MSHALNRLRVHFDDALLVKTPRGMQPTERALGLAAPLHAALEQLDRAVAPVAEFDARQARTFRIGVSDFEAITLVRPLLSRLRAEAPRVDLRLMSLAPAHVPDLLARGELDLVLKPLAQSDQAESVYHQRLLEHERFVVVARKGNPHVGKRLTLKRYVEAPHVLIAPGGTPRGVVDELLDGASSPAASWSRVPTSSWRRTSWPKPICCSPSPSA